MRNLSPLVPTTVTLTFGDPDPSVRDRIRADLLRQLRYFDATIYSDANLIGEWDGVPEHSGVIVAEIRHAKRADRDLRDCRSLDAFRVFVRGIAAAHGQTAIGCLLHHKRADEFPTLVGPTFPLHTAR
jgi:hypothetical protein